MPVAEKPRTKRPNPVYPANLREYARRLYADNGYSTHQIRKSIEGLGYNPPPSHCTIRCWVDDEYREERLRRQRRFQSKGVDRHWKRGWQQRLQRMGDLRDKAKLSASATARVMAHDFDIHLTRHQVEAILSGKAEPKTIKRLLHPRGAQS